MLEIYNEHLNDLLTKSSGAALDIRVQGKTVSVPGLTQIQVQTEADILSVMETGEKNRKIASTKMNTQRCSASSQEQTAAARLTINGLIFVLQFPVSPGGGAGGGGLGPGLRTDISWDAHLVRSRRLRTDLQDRS